MTPKNVFFHNHPAAGSLSSPATPIDVSTIEIYSAPTARTFPLEMITPEVINLRTLPVLERDVVVRAFLKYRELGINVMGCPNVREIEAARLSHGDKERKKIPYLQKMLFTARAHICDDNCPRYLHTGQRCKITLEAMLYDPIAGGANIAAICGWTSGNLTVFDCETFESFERMLKWMRSHNIPCWAYIGRRGGSIMIRIKEGEVLNLPKGEFAFDKDVEVWGRSHHVIIPPSYHICGNLYQFVGDNPLDQVNSQTLVPVSIHELKALTGLRLYRKKMRERPEAWVAMISERNYRILMDGSYAEGERNNGMINLIYELAAVANKGMLSKEEAISELENVNQRNTPPMEASDIAGRFHYCYTHDAKLARERFGDSDPVRPYFEIALDWIAGYEWSGPCQDSDKKVALAICQRAKQERIPNFRLPVRTIAKMTGLSLNTTHAALLRLSGRAITNPDKTGTVGKDKPIPEAGDKPEPESQSPHLIEVVNQSAIDAITTYRKSKPEPGKEKPGRKISDQYLPAAIYKFNASLLWKFENRKTDTGKNPQPTVITTVSNQRLFLPNAGGMADTFKALPKSALWVWQHLCEMPGSCGAAIARQMGLKSPDRVQRVLPLLIQQGLAIKGNDGMIRGVRLTDEEFVEKSDHLDNAGWSKLHAARLAYGREYQINRALYYVRVGWLKRFYGLAEIDLTQLNIIEDRPRHMTIEIVPFLDEISHLLLPNKTRIRVSTCFKHHQLLRDNEYRREGNTCYWSKGVLSQDLHAEIEKFAGMRYILVGEDKASG
jgi:hypothetical protein